VGDGPRSACSQLRRHFSSPGKANSTADFASLLAHGCLRSRNIRCRATRRAEIWFRPLIRRFRTRRAAATVDRGSLGDGPTSCPCDLSHERDRSLTGAEISEEVTKRTRQAVQPTKTTAPMKIHSFHRSSRPPPSRYSYLLAFVAFHLAVARTCASFRAAACSSW
jgi:hypothetical protein